MVLTVINHNALWSHQGSWQEGQFIKLSCGSSQSLMQTCQEEVKSTNNKILQAVEIYLTQYQQLHSSEKNTHPWRVIYRATNNYNLFKSYNMHSENWILNTHCYVKWNVTYLRMKQTVFEIHNSQVLISYVNFKFVAIFLLN